MALVLEAILLVCFTYFLLRIFRWRFPEKFRLAGYNVLITGGSSGIGFSLAELFYQSGANVSLLARDCQRLEAAKLKLKQTFNGGGSIHLLSIDLREGFDQLQTKLQEHISETGPVDILINCAGFAVSRTFMDTPPHVVNELIETNYLGAVKLTQLLLPTMMSDHSRSTLDRRIAFVCSMAAQVSVFGMAAYTGSKCALRGFAETLRLELEHSGPLVTLAFPPDTDTPGFAAENVGKPVETSEISHTGGLASPKQVASVVFRDILAGKLISSYGLEGSALSLLTAGMLPPTGLSRVTLWTLPGVVGSCILDVLLIGPLRAFAIGYAFWMRRLVSKHARRKNLL